VIGVLPREFHLPATWEGTDQSLAQPLRTAVWSLDKDIPLKKVQPMNSYVDEWQSQRKFTTLLLGLFAGLALLLALMGIYGVLSNLVAARVREIGIRMAVGARPAEIGKLVLGQSMVPVAAGAALGVAGTLALGRFLESLLFQVRPRDPATIVAATAMILLVVPLAIAVPIRRAARVDCTVALREE
jgi:putative ABC transport system permease protein